jgi:hypothetical protein
VGKEQGLSGSDGAEVVAVAGRGSKHGVEVEWIACIYEGCCILLPCSTKEGDFSGTTFRRLAPSAAVVDSDPFWRQW